MNNHCFKAIYLPVELEYLIVDLSDPRIVGVTKSFYLTHKGTRKAVFLREGCLSGTAIGAQVEDYRIFIIPYDGTTSEYYIQGGNEDYLRRVMGEMAIFFMKSVIKRNPDAFEKNHSPIPSKQDFIASRRLWKRRWFFVWAVVGSITLIAAVIACVVWWDTVKPFLQFLFCITFGLPIFLIMGLAYLDDILARRGF